MIQNNIYRGLDHLKALSINSTTKQIEALDIEMKANTVYSFFNSILTDELSSLNQHTIYCDANALSQQKQAYFIGEQLILGDVLIVGLMGMEESDANIPKEELEKLINYDVNAFYQEVIALLAQSDVNLYHTFEVEQDGEVLHLNAEWVLYTFDMADDRTKTYFIAELTKSLEAKEETALYLKKMAQLAINAAR